MSQYIFDNQIPSYRSSPGTWQMEGLDAALTRVAGQLLTTLTAGKTAIACGAINKALGFESRLSHIGERRIWNSTTTRH